MLELSLITTDQGTGWCSSYCIYLMLDIVTLPCNQSFHLRSFYEGHPKGTRP